MRIWDITLEVSSHSRLLLGANSVYIYALTLSGETRTGKIAAPAGKILVWSHYGLKDGAPKVYTFAADRLQTVFAGNGRAGDPDVDSIVQSQKRKRFWGLLRPTNTNVAQPVSIELEDLRRSYQTSPEMIALKRSSRDKADYAVKTVEVFVAALVRGDAQGAARFISPALFLEGAEARQAHQLLMEERVAFARRIIGSGGWQKFQPGTVSDLGGGNFSISAGGRSLQITLGGFDDGLYVTSLKPE